MNSNQVEEIDMSKIAKTKKVERTSLSDFVRNTSEADKRKIYIEVMQKADELQQEILKKAALLK